MKSLPTYRITSSKLADDHLSMTVAAEGPDRALALHREIMVDTYGYDLDGVDLQCSEAPGCQTVGKRWRGPFGEGTYLCLAMDLNGFWMHHEGFPSQCRNVSDRALGRTFHRIFER